MNPDVYRVYTPPNQDHCLHSLFLSTRQVREDLAEYVQWYCTLIVAMQLTVLSEVI